MSINALAKYYQKTKKGFKRKLVNFIKIFLKKKKSGILVVNNIKIS